MKNKKMVLMIMKTQSSNKSDGLISTKKFDRFLDALEFGHSLRFPGKPSFSGDAAKSGLYNDKSHSGISDREYDFHQMKEWLGNNGFISQSELRYLDQADSQRKIAAGLIKLWESYKLSFIATKNAAWTHPFGIHSSLASALAKDFTDETIERVFADAALPRFCIDEAKAARNAGVGIHQAYGSWRLMVQAFFDRESEIGLTETTKPQFVISASKLIKAYKESKLVPDGDWRSVAETHIMADVTPDDVYVLYQKIKKNPADNVDLANDLYGKIFETPYRMNGNFMIVKADEVPYAVGDLVMINCARIPGVITEIDEKGCVVMADQKYTLSLDSISLDIQSGRSPAREFGN